MTQLRGLTDNIANLSDDVKKIKGDVDNLSDDKSILKGELCSVAVAL